MLTLDTTSVCVVSVVSHAFSPCCYTSEIVSGKTHCEKELHERAS
jgi:hypothetical protein